MIPRHKTTEVEIGNIKIGGKNPVVIQSMTSTPTADIEKTSAQILELKEAGARMVRITVNDADAAAAVPRIFSKVRKKSDVPIIGDFHFNGNILLKKFPECAKCLDKFRINPGNASDQNFREMCEIAAKLEKPIRIGVNGGSLDRKILDDFMEKFAGKKSSDEIFVGAMAESALKSAKLAENFGVPKNKIVLSTKVSELPQMVRAYEILAKKSDYALHLGLTEAGSGDFGMIQSAAALAILLYQGIGDTIRISITPKIDESRTREVAVAQKILQSLELQNFRPKIVSCPGCGRTTSDFFRKLAESVNVFCDQNLQKYPNLKNLKIAVMGCVVNGPGESQNCNIAISLPGKGENFAVVFCDGKKFCDLKGENIEAEFLGILEEYLDNRLHR